MGAVLVMVAARNAGAGRGQWVTGGAVVAAVALVVVADVANPEAFVARHNIDRTRAGAELDVGYLGMLADDAVPALVHAAERGAPVDGAIRCVADRSGVAVLNLGAARSAKARDRYCRA
jgi:hypothetical protein